MAVILVTGATGRHGGSGAHVARRLRELGHQVRLLVRKDDERSAALRDAGYEVCIGDLRDRSSLLPAMEGVDQASFCFPVDAGIVEAAACFGSALRTMAPAARVVVMSMRMAQAASPSHLGRAAWLAEEVLINTGLQLRILRFAALFHENLPLLHGTSIRREGLMRNCFGDASIPWIAAEDAAELMVATLLSQDWPAEEAISYPPGAERLSHAEIAALLSEQLGRRVAYQAISPQQWQQELLDLAEDEQAVVNADMARHISAIGAAMAAMATPAGSGAAQTSAVPPALDLAGLIGRQPLGLRDFIRREAGRLMV